MKKGKLFLTFYYLIILIYLEMVYKITIFGLSGINYQTLYMIAYLISISFVLSTITRLFNERENKIVMSIILFMLGFWFSVEFVFKKIFDTFFCLALFSLSDQAVAFAGDAIKLIIINIYGVILLFIPFIVTFFLRKKHLILHKLGMKKVLIMIVLTIISFGFYKGSLLIFKNKVNSGYELVYKINNNAMNLEKVGVSLSTALDIKRTVFGFSESIINDPSDDENIDVPSKNPEYGYNNVNIDFDNLISNETNNEIKQMHEYFSNDSGTQKNEYTGLYKEKNLIVFMAESFNEIGVREDLTPTLYKLVNSSFVFDNFYTPVNLSTIGGEFQELTGLFANLSMLSNKWRKGTNYYPYGIGTMFKNINYDTYAYHANQYNFQNRDVYLKKMGFDNYIGRYNGMEKLMNCNMWPQSDYDMVSATIDTILDTHSSTGEPFLSYYVTVSGHMPYAWTNAMARKNKSLVDSLPYSDLAKGYLATQIELDRALELLIQKLTDAGELDNTVIALVADHYPYDLDLDVINELSDYTKDGIVEINRSNLIIYNSTTPTTHVTKTTSQLDFMPTLYNLFGLEYDSRLFIGKDALSTYPGLVFFTNRSFVTDKGTYYASSGKFVSKDGSEVDKEYIQSIKNSVSNRINMSTLIMKNNYYNIVLGEK